MGLELLLGLNEGATLSLELFDRVSVDAPHFIVKFEQFHCFSQSALLDDIRILLRRCQRHLIYNMLIHLHGKKATHLSVHRRNIVKESDMTNHVFESDAFFIADHLNAYSPLVFPQNFNFALLCPTITVLFGDR